MSRTDFSNFQSKLPAQKRTLERLQDWADQHPEKRLFEPARIAHELKDTSALDLAFVLSVLSNEGFFKRVLRVRSPSTRTLINDEFGSFDEIPDELTDTQNRRFHLEDADVVPAFRQVDT